MRLCILTLVSGMMCLPPSIAIADSEDKLRRLFTTPLERNRIDSVRNNTAKSSDGLRAAVEKTFVDRVEVNGLVIRGNGDHVVWVNGQSNLKGNRINEALRVHPRHINKNKTNVPLQVSDQWLRMQPGQVWNGSSGKIVDSYQTKEAKTTSGGVADQPGSDDNERNEVAESSGGS